MPESIESKDSNEKVKKIAGFASGIIAFAVAYFAVQYFLFPSFDKVMMRAASELNETCPIMVDEHTRLDNAVALPNNVFQYNYTLVNWTIQDVQADSLEKYLEPSLVNNVRTNPDMKIYRDNESTVSYYYKDKNGEFVLKISVTPDMYQ